MHRQYAPSKHTPPINLMEQNMLIWQQLQEWLQFQLLRGIFQEISIDDSEVL